MLKVVCNLLGVQVPTAGVWFRHPLMSTHFLVTPLGKKKKNKIQSTSNMGSKGDGSEKSDRSNLNQDNIIFP